MEEWQDGVVFGLGVGWRGGESGGGKDVVVIGDIVRLYSVHLE